MSKYFCILKIIKKEIRIVMLSFGGLFFLKGFDYSAPWR